jgi:glycosyltransferase involved in cell wall biosynthesis
VSLDLYGPVVRRGELLEWQTLVNDLNANGSIRYRGTLAPDDMLRTLTEYDALVVASHSESFGLAAAEAMMNKVAVISTRTGFLESLPDDCFTTLPARTAAGIRRVIADAAAAPAMLTQKAHAAFEFASVRLGEDATFDRWIALYERIARPARTETRPDPAGPISEH